METLRARSLAVWRAMDNGAWADCNDGEIVEIAQKPAYCGEVVHVARTGSAKDRERAVLALFLCRSKSALDAIKSLQGYPDDGVREAAAEVIRGRVDREPAVETRVRAHNTRTSGSAMYDW